MLAYIHLFYDWNWNAALKEYDKAIECGLPHQNEFISYYYTFIAEDFERAIKVAKQVIETDPLHVISHWQLGLIYYFARRFDEAIGAFTDALEIDPNFGEALRFRGLVKGYLGTYKEALMDIHRAIELASGQGLANLDILVVKILMGKKEEVLAVIKTSEYVDSSDPALLYSLLNISDEAMYWLEKAYQERSVMMVTLKNFWVWDNLRHNPRFQEIYDRMNFPPSIKNRATLKTVNISKPVLTQTSLLNRQEIETYVFKLEELMNEEEIFLDKSLSLR